MSFQLPEIGQLGDGTGQVPLLVEDCQPHADPMIRHFDRIAEVGADFLQMVSHFRADGRILQHPDIGYGHPDIREIFDDIAPDASVNELDLPDVAPLGIVGVSRKALDVYKRGSDHNCRLHFLHRHFRSG